MTLIIVSFLLLGYLAIATEHLTNINKAAVAMFLGVTAWILFMIDGRAYVEAHYAQAFVDYLQSAPATITRVKMFIANHVFVKYVAQIAAIVLFLLATMSIVEVLHTNGCFDFITRLVRTRSNKRLLWSMALVTYLISANLDNLTTTIMMLVILKQLVASPQQRMLYGAVIVLAASCGGCFTVIGDVTTLMLWGKEAVTPSNFSGALVLPSLVALILPTYLISRKLPERAELVTNRTFYRGDDTALSLWQRALMLFVGIGGLWFIPTFHRLTKLPPFVGALCVLGLTWVVHELCNRKFIKSEQPAITKPLPRYLQYENIQTILFVIGLGLAIGAIVETGAMSELAHWCDRHVHNIYIVSVVQGLLSAIVDNIALVLSSISMYDVLDEVQMVTGYNEAFVVNGQYWHLVAYSIGVGGCLLPIGSTSGYALMKSEQITFWWYFRKISGKVLVGWLAGLMVYFVVDVMIR